MGARTCLGLIVVFVAACGTRSSENVAPAPEDAAPKREPADASQATEPAPQVDVTWRLVPTRTQGALAFVDEQSGRRSEVFNAALPLECTSAKPTRGALLAARCTGKDAPLSLTARRSQQEVIVTAGTGKKTEIVGRVPLPAGVRTVRARTGADDVARAGELLIDWSFTPYHDVHAVITKPGPPPASVEQFIAELIGCEPGAPAAAAQDVLATLTCRHRDRTETLSARLQPGFVLVVHTASGEGLEQHQIDAQEIPLPKTP
jgi:hypothetical protein